MRVVFKRPPYLSLAPSSHPPSNELVLRIDPKPGADLAVQAKTPGAQSTRTVDLSLIFSEELGDLPEPYERLLGDALRGDASLFTREDSVEETWRIVQPLLDAAAAGRDLRPRLMGTARVRTAAGGIPALAPTLGRAPFGSLSLRGRGRGRWSATGAAPLGRSGPMRHLIA